MLDRAAADLVLTPALQQIDRLRALLKEDPRSTLSMRTWPRPPLCRALDPLNHASISP